MSEKERGRDIETEKERKREREREREKGKGYPSLTASSKSLKRVTCFATFPFIRLNSGKFSINCFISKEERGKRGGNSLIFL